MKWPFQLLFEIILIVLVLIKRFIQHILCLRRFSHWKWKKLLRTKIALSRFARLVSYVLLCLRGLWDLSFTWSFTLDALHLTCLLLRVSDNLSPISFKTWEKNNKTSFRIKFNLVLSYLFQIWNMTVNNIHIRKGCSYEITISQITKLSH